MDEIIRAVSKDGFVKICVISARDTVERARQIHKTSPVATAALGRSLCAISMLGNMLKEPNASVTMRINGGGPLGGLLVVSDSDGNPRGYVENPAVELPNRPDGKLDVGGAVGKNGLLTVSRDLGLREPYVGSTELISGEIAEDFTKYYVESEQVGAACGLGVLVNTDRSVLAAGGYIVQLLPGAPEEHAALMEDNVALCGPVTDVLRDFDADELLQRVMLDLEPHIVERCPVEYRCSCSRERVLNALRSTGAEALEEMAADEEDLTITCQFCDSVYSVTPAELRALAETPEN